MEKLKLLTKKTLYAGLFFDFAGSYPASVYGYIQERRGRRPKSVEDAMYRDISVIAGDMHQAMDKWIADHE